MLMLYCTYIPSHRGSWLGFLRAVCIHWAVQSIDRALSKTPFRPCLLFTRFSTRSSALTSPSFPRISTFYREITLRGTCGQGSWNNELREFLSWGNEKPSAFRVPPWATVVFTSAFLTSDTESRLDADWTLTAAAPLWLAARSCFRFPIGSQIRRWAFSFTAIGSHWYVNG